MIQEENTRDITSLNRELQYVIFHDNTCNKLFHQHQRNNLTFEEMLIQMVVLLYRRKELQDIELCQYAEKDRIEMIMQYARKLKEKE